MPLGHWGGAISHCPSLLSTRLRHLLFVSRANNPASSIDYSKHDLARTLSCTGCRRIVMGKVPCLSKQCVNLAVTPSSDPGVGSLAFYHCATLPQVLGGRTASNMGADVQGFVQLLSKVLEHTVARQVERGIMPSLTYLATSQIYL